MKEVRIARFFRKKPEDISFTGSPVPSEPPQESNLSPSKHQEVGRSNVQTTERSDERSNVFQDQPALYIVNVPEERKKIRQSFDIFEDQKEALDKIQLAFMDILKRKPLLGELIQEALDAYFKHKAKSLSTFRFIKTKTVRTDERSNDRSEA